MMYDDGNQASLNDARWAGVGWAGRMMRAFGDR